MAMLAEPRRKVKWSLNPRGKLWSEDSNKFGQRMLEKMGWSAGKGLGAHGQGTTSHIGVKLKTDNRGVGYGGKDIDWCKHQTKFDEVLADLGQNMEAVGNESTFTSLEKISKQSKSRLHYHKFTRGKDLTQYSKKDLDCILGISSKGDEVPLEEQTVTEDPGARDDSFGVVTVLGGSMEDYLKKKKWHSRTISGNILSESVGCCDGSTEGKNGLCLETEENNLPCDRECDQVVSAKIKKKKSKKKDLSESVGCCDGSTEGKNGLCLETVEENNLPCDRECDQDVSAKIKKKKSKKKDLNESVGCCDGSTEEKEELCIETVEKNKLPCDRECDQDVGEKIRKKKSKKKALSKSVDFPTEGNNELCIETVEENNLSCGRECEQEICEKPKKKRSKKKDSSESVGCFDRSTEGKKGLIETVEENNLSCGRECEQDVGEKIRKKKSKKKSRVELDNVDGELSFVVSQDEPISKEPKSKRKRRHSMTDISNDKDNSQKLEKDEFKSLKGKVGKSKKSRCAKECECDDPKQLCENMNIVKYFKCFDKKVSLETSLPSSIQMFHGSNLGEIKGYGCEITS